MANWQDYLELYYMKYGYNFIVQKIADFPYPWLEYGTPKYKNFIKREKYVSQREVFYDEIVFDIDMDDSLSLEEAREESVRIAMQISERLRNANYSHTVWKSGGAGCHIHLFFSELFKLNSIDNKIMKKVFLKEFGSGYIRPRETKGKVQLQTLKTIQIEYSPHRKGGKKTLFYNYSSKQPNLFIPAHYQFFEAEKNKNNLIKKYMTEYDVKNKPTAISFLENERFHNVKDGRDRALFILTAYYKQFLEKEELFAKLDEWNRRVLKGYFPAKVIRAKVKSARPCYARNYLIELLDDLGLDQEYIKKLINEG